MPRKVRCVRCGGHVSDVGRLSARKRCAACAESAMVDALVQLRARRGEIYDRWRRNAILALLNLDRGDGPPVGLISDADLERIASRSEADALP